MTWLDKLSKEAEASFANGMKSAQRFVYQQTGVAHLITGLLDTEDTLINLQGEGSKNLCLILADLGVEQTDFSYDVEGKIREHYQEQKIGVLPGTTDALGAVMILAGEYAEAAGQPQIRPEHMLYAAAKVLEGETPMTPEETAVRQVLQDHKLTSERIEQYSKK